MSISPSEVCINHTLAVTQGYLSEDFTSMVKTRRKRMGKNNEYFAWEIVKSLLEKPKPGEASVNAYFIENIPNHATSLCVFVKDGKKICWYHNPWGFHEDSKNITPLTINPGLNEYLNHVSSRNLLDESFVKEFEAKNKFFYYEFVILLIMNYRLRNFLSRLPADRLTKIDKEYNKWNAGREGPVPREGFTHVDHITTTIMLLKLLFNAEHLEVLHPRNTMPFHGPQVEYDDGMSECASSILPGSVSLGACTIWSSFYNRRVESVLSRHLYSRRPISYTIETIQTTLRTNYLEQEKTAREKLAKFIDEDGGQKVIKNLLRKVFNLIPENPELRTRNMMAFPLETDWHKKVFGKMNQIMDKFKLLDVNKGVEFIPGFIEVLTLIASRGVEVSAESMDAIRKIVVELERRALLNLKFLEKFITMTTILIICKHEGNAINVKSSVESKLPVLTRNAKRVADTRLEDHFEVFNHGMKKMRK